jgi:hypothetical protein
MLSDLARFGPKYLSPAELKGRFRTLTGGYYRALVPTLLAQPANKEFWQKQRTELRAVGLEFSRIKLLQAAMQNGLRFLLKPHVALKKFLASRRNPDQIEAKYYEQESSS